MQGDNYSTVCLLDYDYIKSHYRLIAVNLSRQIQLDDDGIIADDTQPVFVQTILEEIMEVRLNFLKGV